MRGIVAGITRPRETERGAFGERRKVTRERRQIHQVRARERERKRSLLLGQAERRRGGFDQ